jgi:flagellar biogenesis protein FliO
MAMRLVKYSSLIAAALLPVVTAAADTARSGADKLRDLGFADSSAGSLPMGRVLLAFLLVAALAVCAVWLLRRYGPRFRTVGPVAPIRIVARSSLPGGTSCQVVEVQGKHVLITSTRNGVTSLVLGEAPAPPPSEGPQ